MPTVCENKERGRLQRKSQDPNYIEPDEMKHRRFAAVTAGADAPICRAHMYAEWTTRSESATSRRWRSLRRRHKANIAGESSVGDRLGRHCRPSAADESRWA